MSMRTDYNSDDKILTHTDVQCLDIQKIASIWQIMHGLTSWSQQEGEINLKLQQETRVIRMSQSIFRKILVSN